MLHKFKKPEQAKDDRDCVGLKQKSQALVRMQQGKAFVGEVKCKVDSISDSDEPYGYLASMTNTGDESLSTSQVHILTSILLSNSELYDY